MRRSLSLIILTFLAVLPSFCDDRIEAKITALNFLKKLVTVEIFNGNLEITFRPKQDIERFNDFGVAHLRFDCAKDGENCDFKNPYQFFVNSEKAEIVEWEFKKLVWAWVAHSPGNGDYNDGFILDAKIGSQGLFLQLKIDQESLKRIKRVFRLKRGDWVLVSFPKDRPQKAIIEGLTTTIVVFDP